MKPNYIKNIAPINWWESKRWIYNLVLIITFVVVYLKHTTSTQELSLTSAAIWLLGANIFYTMSWACELLFFRMFGKYPFSKEGRVVLFGLGLICSIWWTLMNL